MPTEIRRDLSFRRMPEPEISRRPDFRTNPEPEIEEELCYGCFCCITVCPRGVLIEPQIGMIPLIKTTNECTGCKRCVDECPHNAIRILEVAVASSH